MSKAREEVVRQLEASEAERGRLVEETHKFDEKIKLLRSRLEDWEYLTEALPPLQKGGEYIDENGDIEKMNLKQWIHLKLYGWYEDGEKIYVQCPEHGLTEACVQGWKENIFCLKCLKCRLET